MTKTILIIILSVSFIGILFFILVRNALRRKLDALLEDEKRKKSNKFDYIEIYFDKYGIVKNFEFFNLNDMNNIKFAKEKTRSLGVKDTFAKNLLSSTRKRMENARKKFEKKKD